ncbi:hypothetical protein HDV05_002876, partial [Chytridiales sp. JEL 0842]
PSPPPEVPPQRKVLAEETPRHKSNPQIDNWRASTPSDHNDNDYAASDSTPLGGSILSVKDARKKLDKGLYEKT